MSTVRQKVESLKSLVGKSRFKEKLRSHIGEKQNTNTSKWEILENWL